MEQGIHNLHLANESAKASRLLLELVIEELTIMFNGIALGFADEMC